MTPTEAIRTLRLHAEDYAAPRDLVAAVDAVSHLAPETGEAFFVDRDVFLAYVENKVNPAREAEGLETVGNGAASHLYDVIINRRYRQ